MFDLTNLNAVEKMIMNKLTRYMELNGVQYVGVRMENGKVDFEVYKEPVRALTLSEINNLLNQLENGNNGNDKPETVNS